MMLTRGKKQNFITRLTSLPASVKRVSFIVFLYGFGWAVANPFWAIYFKEKLVSYSLTGLALGLMPLFSIVWVLIWGKIIDRFPKNKIIAVILLSYLPFSFLLLSLQTFPQIIIFFIYHSFIASSLWIAFETYLRNHSPRDKAAESFGFYDTLFGLAYVAGPIIGGILFSQFSYGIFIAISAMSLIAFFVALTLPDKDHFSEFELPPRKSIAENFREWWQNHHLRSFTILVGLLSLASSFLAMLLPLLTKDQGAQFWQIGVLMALFAVPALFESFFSTIPFQKNRIIISLAIGAFLFLALTIARDIYLLFIIALLLALSITSVYPLLQGKITTAMPRKLVGSLTSITFALANAAAALGPIIGGFFSDLLGIHSVFFIGFLIFGALIIFLLYSKSFPREIERVE